MVATLSQGDQLALGALEDRIAALEKQIAALPPTTTGPTVIIPAQGGVESFTHRPWCLYVVDGTADQPDDAGDAALGAVLHHPDGDDVCPGHTAFADDGWSGSVGSWLVGDGGVGGTVELLVTGTARYRTRSDVADLIRQLTEQAKQMPPD